MVRGHCDPPFVMQAAFLKNDDGARHWLGDFMVQASIRETLLSDHVRLQEVLQTLRQAPSSSCSNSMLAHRLSHTLTSLIRILKQASKRNRTTEVDADSVNYQHQPSLLLMKFATSIYKDSSISYACRTFVELVLFGSAATFQPQQDKIQAGIRANNKLQTVLTIATPALQMPIKLLLRAALNDQVFSSCTICSVDYLHSMKLCFVNIAPVLENQRYVMKKLL